MGNSGHTNNQISKQYQQELQFYIEVQDRNLGLSRIYTSKKMPLCYILKYDSIVSDSKIFNLFSQVEQVQSNALLSMYGFKIQRDTCCNSLGTDRITAYWEYYNFYFDEYMKKRCQHKCMFIDTQLWHLIEVCSEGYSIFKKYGTYVDIDPNSMVITPEGKLKICWGHLKSQNNHMKFFKYFESKEIQKFFYSPEELECMYLGQRTTKLDFDKCNTFRLGMILLACLTLMDPLSFCYNPSFTKINFNIIKNIIITKVAPSYEPDFVSFLKLLLRQNPKERPTLLEIYERYNKYMSPDYELRVCGKGPRGGQESKNWHNFMGKKNSDISDTKTVKFNHSVRKG